MKTARTSFWTVFFIITACLSLRKTFLWIVFLPFSREWYPFSSPPPSFPKQHEIENPTNRPPSFLFLKELKHPIFYPIHKCGKGRDGPMILLSSEAVRTPEIFLFLGGGESMCVTLSYPRGRKSLNRKILFLTGGLPNSFLWERWHLSREMRVRPTGIINSKLNVNPFYGLIVGELFSWLHAKCFNAH